VVEGVEEYEVEKVLNAQSRCSKVEYLVKWEDYGHADNKWVSVENMHTLEALQDLYTHHPTAIWATCSDCPWRVQFEDALESGVILTVFWKKNLKPWRGGDVRGQVRLHNPVSPEPPLDLQTLLCFTSGVYSDASTSSYLCIYSDSYRPHNTSDPFQIYI
jgi:hypothetical protein